MKVLLHSIWQQIWKIQLWPQDWKRSVFIPIPKKGNAKKCSNYHTIARISLQLGDLGSVPGLGRAPGEGKGYPLPYSGHGMGSNKLEGEKAGLKLNIQKMKIMASGPITLWQINGEREGGINWDIFPVVMYGCEEG